MTQSAAVAPSPNRKVRFPPRTAFARTLNERVQAHLAATSAPRVRWRMWLKTAVILLWAFGSYGLLVFAAQAWWQAVPLAVSLGLAMAAIGFSIQHDANHGAYPASPRWRRLLGYTLDLLGTSSYVWRYQHNVQHHTYTNIDGADADIDVGIFARLSPAQPRRSFHRHQHRYIWFLYGLYVFQWLFYSEWHDLWRSKVGENAFPRPKGRELAGLIVVKVISLTLWFGPLFFHSFLNYAGSAFVAISVMGFTLALTFQLAHVVDNAQFPQPAGDPARTRDEWAVHQLQTTSNFAPQNRLLSWFMGGLNYQVEHHLFPRVCHLNYPSIAPIVRETCEEFGVAYHAHPTLTQAIRSHYRWLREMGAPTSA